MSINKVLTKAAANEFAASFSSLPQRFIEKSFPSRGMSEGNGAHVQRTIGAISGIENIDPFLMLDEFFVKPPAGFPDHPHRGFETVTYMLEGAFKHKDNIGNAGTIQTGEIQWMTAGRGIIHSELPATPSVNRGLQLWVNLPGRKKSVPPRYQERGEREIPKVEIGEREVEIRIIAGESYGAKSTIESYTDVKYVDISLTKRKKNSNSAEKNEKSEKKENEKLENVKHIEKIDGKHNAFIYVLEGEGLLGSGEATYHAKPKEFLLLSDNGGESLYISTVDSTDSFRFVLVTGMPIGEPIAKYGPFVMNTQAELRQAFIDYQTGKFGPEIKEDL